MPTKPARKADERARPAWLLVVSEYGFKVGPTVPFLLGASVIRPLGKAPASSSVAQTSLFELLNSMHGVRIQWCPTVNDYVVAYVGGNTLDWERTLELDVNGVGPLFGRLWNLYRDVICDGKYSKTGKWHRFTRAELAKIRKVIGLPSPSRRPKAVPKATGQKKGAARTKFPAAPR